MIRSKNFFIGGLLLIVHTFAVSSGALLLTRMPEEITQCITKIQTSVAQQITTTKKYLFNAGEHDPHISLSYLTTKKITMPQLEKHEPELTFNLAAIAQNTALIDMKASLSNAYFEFWVGMRENTFEGKSYHNYLILVLKLECAELSSFVTKIDQMLLANHPKTVLPRQFPFAAHITIGWLYDKKDENMGPIVEKIKPVLEKYLLEIQAVEYFTIDSFQLVTSDARYKNFELSKPVTTAP